jgi:hypothetical protein
MHAALILVWICGARGMDEHAALDACEHGEIRAASCDAAERWLRAGLRHGQTLHVMGCRQMEVAGR